MIYAREIKEKARENGVPESTIERDYVQNWLLKYLSSFDLVLKGGTGIRKVYIKNYRFSDDLDFTLLEEIERKELEDKMKEIIFDVKEESGINFFEDLNIEENENGFEVICYFYFLRKSGDPMGIKLDFTNKSREIILLEPKHRKIIHPYSDNLKFKIRTYPLKEIMAEKIRALFERTRPRDLYDIWYLKKKINIQSIKDLIYKKCEFKKVNIETSDLEDRKEDFKNAWKNSLKHQLKHVPDFGKIYEEVLKGVKKL